MVKQVIWSSMIDYPKNISTVIFFDKCNLNCEYCYNRELYNMSILDFNIDILPKLLERKEFINHIILSGGECTINNEFQEILDVLYEKGFKIGIHTNGTRPDIIEKNIQKISFLGIDVKTTLDKYYMLSNEKIDSKSIEKTIKLAIDNNKEYQCRTTIYPDIVDENDCINIAKYLKKLGVQEYTIQQYYAIGSAKQIESYSIDKLKKIQDNCNKIIKTNLKTK
ncbi:MAG: anaerobic ribonucleoside-triphosphate reductase activating protein [Clostridiales bacterium]|nr:anaerobic ribonucleoside-triphosphate reductase activating protein [Clostridiales bacterium]